MELLRAIVRNLKSVDLPFKKTELSADALLEALGAILMGFGKGVKNIDTKTVEESLESLGG